MRTRLTTLALLSVLLAACSDDPVAPAGSTVGTPAELRGGAPKFWETGATVAWNELADRLIALALGRRNGAPPALEPLEDEMEQAAEACARDAALPG